MDKRCFGTGRLAYKNTSPLPAFYHNNCWRNASTLTEHTGWMRNLQTPSITFSYRPLIFCQNDLKGTFSCQQTGLAGRHVNRSIAYLSRCCRKLAIHQCGCTWTIFPASACLAFYYWRSGNQNKSRGKWWKEEIIQACFMFRKIFFEKGNVWAVDGFRRTIWWFIGWERAIRNIVE